MLEREQWQERYNNPRFLQAKLSESRQARASLRSDRPGCPGFGDARIRDCVRVSLSSSDVSKALHSAPVYHHGLFAAEISTLALTSGQSSSQSSARSIGDWS